MELLATAFEPYTALPSETVLGVVGLVMVAGCAIIFGLSEILSRGRWNREFADRTALALGPVMRSHERRGRQRQQSPAKAPEP